MKRLSAITILVILLLCLTIACGRKGPDAAPDKTPPEIVATNPALGSVDVPSNTAISVTFSKAVIEKTISFLLMSIATGTVPCTMSYSDKTATFTPSNALSYNTQYFATISAGVTDMLGNVMPSDYPWSFTTGTAPDTTPPAVLPGTLVPAGNAINVSIFPTISVTFSEPVNPSTVNSGTVKVSGNGSEVPGTVTLDITGAKAIFILSGALAYNTTYTVTIVGGASGVKDMAGNALATDYIWSFTTAPQPPYTITASAGANGTISPAGSVGVNSGANQQFTITPNTGYHVANVLVDGNSIGAVTTYTFFNITANHTIAASFSINTYTVTPSVSGGNGTISPSTAQTVNYNGSTSFTVTPNAGYSTVMGGTCGGSLVGNTYTTNPVIANCTVTAIFSLNTNTITASAGANGTISPAGSVAVNYGANQQFTITPNTGYHVASVLVDGASVGAVTTYTFTNVIANHTISASFAINTYTVTPSVSGGNGSITPNTPQTVNYNATPSFTVTPATGYSINTVGGTCGGTLVGNTYTTNPVTANCTVVASFAINTITFTITASADTNGTISPSGSVLVVQGANQSFTITPNTGYHVADVLVDGISVGAVTSYTFSNVTADHTISANFSINQYTVSATAGSNGSLDTSTPSPATINYNLTASFTFNADAVYHVASITDTCGSAGYTNTSNSVTTYTYTTTAITSDCTVTATFAINTYTITATQGPHGSISPLGTVSVNSGADQSFTITPQTGRSILDVKVDGVSQGAIASYTFTNVTANHTIDATFI